MLSPKSCFLKCERWALYVWTALSYFCKSQSALNKYYCWICSSITKLPTYFIENPILPFDISKDNTISVAHARNLISLLCYKIAIVFVLLQVKVFFFFFFFFSSLYLKKKKKFIYVLYIWSEKNILKVEFLINKTPSNIDLLTKTTRYHQRFWNICWKIFKFVCALFVLAIYMIYLFSFGYWKNLWVHTLYFSFLLWVNALFLHALL